MAQIEDMTQWCSENVAPKTYHIANNSGYKIGGTGWELTMYRSSVSAYIEDESLSMFFSLKFVKA